MRDEITELAVELGVTPLFPPPAVLSTRIATSETYGIHPIPLKLAEKYNIVALPFRRVVGIPLHRDVPVNMLSRLSTKPISRYQYIQSRQHTSTATGPVHTFAEFKLFKEIINLQVFKKQQQVAPATHEVYKAINFDELTKYWNIRVQQQDRTESDVQKRLYFKLPYHLERHHKDVLVWKSERTTMSMGVNASAFKVFQDLLANSNDTAIMPAALEMPNALINEEHQDVGE